jgi:phytoene dehydrogenase-like protein
VGRSQRYDAVVVGAGHNGLVTAAYLARAGQRVLVVERRDRVGGILDETELAPGVRAPAVVDDVGRLWPSVVDDLQLSTHGLRLIRPEARAFAPNLDGPGLTLWADPRRTADELRPRSSRDARAYLAFDQRIGVLSRFLAGIAASTPPDIQSPSMADALSALSLGRAFRRLHPKARRELFRVLPMPVADLVGEGLDDHALRGAVAARGIRHTAMGPWTAGTVAVLLFDSAGNDGGAAGATAFATGGPRALAEALASAARAAGAEIRTGAPVARVKVVDEGATGVVLDGSGEEIAARAVVSSADPRQTLLEWLGPEDLGPVLGWRASNIRAPGCTARVNLALSGLPAFGGNGPADVERLRGRILVAPGIDALERGADAAKYGRVSDQPYLEATIPTLSDPSMAPEGTHVMSVTMQWAPYRLRQGDWETEREGVGDLVMKTLEGYAPGFSSLVTAREVLTPVDLERRYGLPFGHVLHAEPGLDQFFAWRPLLGFARYRLPIEGLYLCGSGAHPGGGITGRPGANAAREVLKDLKRRRPA